MVVRLTEEQIATIVAKMNAADDGPIDEAQALARDQELALTLHGEAGATVGSSKNFQDATAISEEELWHRIEAGIAVKERAKVVQIKKTTGFKAWHFGLITMGIAAAVMMVVRLPLPGPEDERRLKGVAAVDALAAKNHCSLALVSRAESISIDSDGAVLSAETDYVLKARCLQNGILHVLITGGEQPLAFLNYDISRSNNPEPLVAPDGTIAGLVLPAAITAVTIRTGFSAARLSSTQMELLKDEETDWADPATSLLWARQVTIPVQGLKF